MAYIREHEWEKGQTITAEKLNHMEKGIAAALNAIQNAFGPEYTDGSDKYEVSLGTLGSDTSISAGAITGTTLKATGTTSGNALDITGASGLNGDVDIGGALTVGLNETGKTKDTTLNGKLSVNGQLTTTGISDLKGGLNVGTASANKDANIYGELIVEGTTKAVAWDENNNVTSFAKKAATLNGLVNITGNSTINGDLTVGSEQSRKTIKFNDAMTVKFSNSKNQIIIDGYTKINGSFYVGDENNNRTAYIYGPLSIMEYNSLTHRPTASITLSKDTHITTETLMINAETISLRGATTIDKLTKLIVGDSTSTEDNEIYGSTTISDLTTSQFVVGTAAYVDSEEVEHAATGSTILYGTTSTDNLTVGNATVDNDIATYHGTTTFNTTANILHGETNIDNLIVSAITLNTGIHISEYASGTNSYGLIVDKPSLIYGNVKLGTDTNNIHIRKLNNTSTNIIQLYIAANSDANETFETELNGLLRINKNLVSKKDTILGSENSNAHCDALCSGLCTGSCVTYCTGGCSGVCGGNCVNACGTACQGTCYTYCRGTAVGGGSNTNERPSNLPADMPSYDTLRYTGTALFNTETTTIHGNTEIDNLTIKDNLVVTDGENPLTLSITDLQNLKSSLTNNLTFTDGTDTVTLTIAELQELKNLLSESTGGETP